MKRYLIYFVLSFFIFPAQAQEIKLVVARLKLPGQILGLKLKRVRNLFLKRGEPFLFKLAIPRAFVGLKALI